MLSSQASNNSFYNFKLGYNTNTDVRKSFMNQTVEGDMLETEWERLLQEADKVKGDDRDPDASRIDRKNMINAARKKYMRQLIQTSNTLSTNGVKLRGDKLKKTGKGVAATALIEYYQGTNFGLRPNEGLGNIRDSHKSVNDVVLCLLLLNNESHMHIISDYEMK